MPGKEWLKERDLDISVLEDTEDRRNANIRYLSGHAADALFFATRGRGSILVPWDYNLARKKSRIKNIIPYSDFNRDFTTAIEKICEMEGVKAGARIELPASTPYPIVERVKRKLPTYNIICEEYGFDRFLQDKRMIKTAAEIGQIRKICKMTDAVLHDIEVRVRAGRGIPEYTLALFLEERIRTLGADGPAFDIIAAGPSRSFAIHTDPPASNAQSCGRGFTILDFGIRIRGYNSDITTTIIRGPLSPLQDRMLETVQEAYEKAVGLCRPGNSTLEIASKITEFIEGRGFLLPHALGHGIGLDVHERPLFRTNPESAAVLAAGMVLALEPGIYHPEAGGVRLENDLLITPQGREILTSSHFIVL